jgi:DNA-binding response OmpR family regulator
MTAGRILIVDDDVRLASMLEFLRRLKKKGSAPVLILTALAEEQDRILALELSADDYLLKPFRVRELDACLRALLPRSVNARPDSTPLALGPLAIYPRTMSATLDGVPVRLTSAEFMLLETLARSAGRVQSRETLTHQALGRTLEPFDRCIDTHISNIRRKLRSLDPERGVDIKSSRGHGYVLTVPAEPRA